MARWKSILKVFRPFRSFSFFLELYQTLGKINFEKDRVALREVRQLCALVLAQGIYFVAMFLTPDKTRYQQLVTFDFAAYHRMPRVTNFEIFLLWLCMAFFTHALFFQFASNRAVQLIFKIVFKAHFHARSSSFLLGSSFRADHRLMLCFNIYQVFTIALDMMALFTYVEFMWTMFADFEVGIVERAASLLCFHFFFGLFISALAVFLYVGSILCCLAMLSFFIFFARLNSMTKMIESRTKVTMLRLLAFKQHQVKTLQFLEQINQLFGPLLTTFLCTSLPFNGTVFSFVAVNNHLSLVISILLVLFLVAMSTGMLAMHYLAGRFSQRFHRDYKRIISLNAHHRRCPLLHRLRVVNSIEAFHVHNK